MLAIQSFLVVIWSALVGICTGPSIFSSAPQPWHLSPRLLQTAQNTERTRVSLIQSNATGTRGHAIHRHITKHEWRAISIVPLTFLDGLGNPDERLTRILCCASSRLPSNPALHARHVRRRHRSREERKSEDLRSSEEAGLLPCGRIPKSERWRHPRVEHHQIS